jgi:hypothetical protein
MGSGTSSREREAVHAPPCIAEVKNAWSYTSISSPYVFMAWSSVKHRDNFIYRNKLVAGISILRIITEGNENNFAPEIKRKAVWNQRYSRKVKWGE